jgi:hypothetical protein
MSAIKIFLSPHGPCSFYLRMFHAVTQPGLGTTMSENAIFVADIAERNAEAAEKTGHAALGTRSMHVTTGTSKSTPLPKSPIILLSALCAPLRVLCV